MFQGALRSRIVAKLAGVTLRQLGYWHRTNLIRAHVVPGARGYPRLYSWVDYVKVRAVKKLLEEGLATRRIRENVDFLDAEVPDWYLMPLRAYGSTALITIETITMTADVRRQIALPLLSDVLSELREEGPLGELRSFSDAVEMDPDVVSGNPVVSGTRLETQHVGLLVSRDVPIEDVAEAYRLTPEQVCRALEFNRAAA